VPAGAVSCVRGIGPGPLGPAALRRGLTSGLVRGSRAVPVLCCVLSGSAAGVAVDVHVGVEAGSSMGVPG